MLTTTRPRLPAVLRDEPRYRLLFGSQVLSILGDRSLPRVSSYDYLTTAGVVPVGNLLAG